MKRGSLSTRVALAETSIPEGPRRELRAGVTGIDLELGGVAVRAGDLPLLRRVDGGLRQCLRLAVTAGHGPRRARFSVAAGKTVLAEATAELGAATTVRLFVPAVERPTKVTLESELEGAPGRRDEIELLPQRRWRVHLVHHSHFDLGYTDPQALVLRHHLAYLDSALDLATADHGFHWTIESNLPLEHWLATRPRAARDALLGLVRSGRVEVCALPFTMHAEALSIDELASQLRFAEELRRRHDLEIVAAMQTDVPGGPPGLPLVLAAGGVRYLAVAHNWASRATPHLTGGASLPRAFYWGTASGKRVLVWHTDSPHGIAYLEGNLLGLADSYADAHHLLPEYLAALSSRGHPYAGPHETLGLPAYAREPYPFDLLHLRVQGLLADNAGPSPVPAQIAAAWAREYAYPQLVPSTNRAFFKRLEEEHGAELETFRGDWADWWADGLGSAAREVGFNRRAQTAVRTAQTLHVMADALTGADPELDWAGEADRVYERMALFDEHTWCAAHPAGRALTGRESSELQWQSKAALAVEARDRAEALHEAARARFRSTQLDSILVLNPSGRARTDLVELFVPTGRADSTDRLAVVDVERGERVPHALAAPEPSRNRPQGSLLSFVARDVPALGYRRFELVTDGAAQPAVEPRPVENEHYRVDLDTEGGYALRLVDLELGHNLVDATSSFGFGQIVRDLYGGPLHATARARPGAELTYATPDGTGSSALILSRTTPADGIVCERVSSPVEERITLRTRAAGFETVETTFRLVRGVRRLDVTVRLLKEPTAEKESVHIVFPFAARDPSVTYELTGGVGGGASVPGGAAHVHAIRHWVALQDASAAVAWSTLEAPLVQLGNVFLPYPPYPATIDGAGVGLVTSWVMNNVWDTNFPPTQGGGVRFDYAVSSTLPAADARSLGIGTADALTRPLAGVLGATAAAPVGTACELDAPGIEVVMLAAAAGGGVELQLQSYAEDEVAIRVGGRDVRIAPGDYVTVPVELGRRGA